MTVESYYFTSPFTVSNIARIIISAGVSRCLNVVLLWVPVGSCGKITETTMIYSVDQVAQERGYPLSRQSHQYLEGSCVFFFADDTNMSNIFFSQNNFLERTLNKEFLTPTA